MCRKKIENNQEQPLKFICKFELSSCIVKHSIMKYHIIFMQITNVALAGHTRTVVLPPFQMLIFFATLTIRFIQKNYPNI
jgi:hypothetical protein